MSTLVTEQCAALRQQEATIGIEQLQIALEVFVTELTKTNKSSADISLFETIVSTLIYLSNKHKLLADPQLLGNPLWTILREQVLIYQLRRRQTNDIAYDVLIDLSNLFARLTSHMNKMNVDLFEQLLLHQSLINELVDCFNEIGIHGKHLDDSRLLSGIDFLLLALQRFEKRHNETHKHSLTIALIQPIVEALCSSHAVNMLAGLKPQFSQTISEGQKLLFSTCPLYLRWSSSNRDSELFLRIPRTLLKPYTAWVTSCDTNSIHQCFPQLGDMLRHLTSLLVRPIDWENTDISNEEFYQDYCKLASVWSSFLPILLKETSDQAHVVSMIRFIVQDLYSFTLHSNVLNFMKTIPTLIITLLQLTDSQQDETQLNVYRCLGKLMIEEDIKNMANPSKIAIIYIKFLTNTIDDPKRQGRFYSLLQSSKSKSWVIEALFMSNVDWHGSRYLHQS